MQMLCHESDAVSAFFFVYIKIHVRKGDLKNGKS